MRIIICDDSCEMAEQLQEYTKAFFLTQQLPCPSIAVFNNGKELLTDTAEKDIVFLDIEMPHTSGIDIGNELRKRNKRTIIIIVTAYLDYLDDAMSFHVFRYLSKPLDKQRFCRSLQDALTYYHSLTFVIPVETKQGIYRLIAEQIIAIEAKEKKIIVHGTDQDYYSIQNMEYWKTHLPKSVFFQTHRSFIVNFEHISEFNHTAIRMFGLQSNVYLTRRKYTAFKNAYLLYLESAR